MRRVCLLLICGLAVLPIAHPPCAEAAAQPSENLAAGEAPAPANRLIHETSPYLLQHAHNPVDWFPWGDEAFAAAQRENKPVFLSIGYSTCYWCHVMEKESFEDPEIARVLNAQFIAIKVDREERPAIDEHFLRVTRLLTGQAGWPNSVWLTPDGAPWMASTYLPRAKFLAQLKRAAQQWYSEHDDVDRRARRVAASLAADHPAAGAAETPALNDELVAAATTRFLRAFDPVRGGFRGAPKFPPHGALALLLRRCADTDDTAARTAITRTLDAMWLGGLHDHVGGGFHRYATDERWRVPHFEKMLPDNALLMRAYTDAFRLTGHARYREAVADIFAWVQREMTSPTGAFYAAIDAGDVGREGASYVWRLAEVRDVLAPDDGRLFAEIYNLEDRGNFAEESTGKRVGTNIPFLHETIETIAERRREDATVLSARLAILRARLLAARQSRPQPRRDDKVIASWNGLMIGALAHAGIELAESRYVEAATRAGQFLRQHLVSGDSLLRTYRAGEARIPGVLEDYASVAAGFIALHQATKDPIWLTEADRLAAVMLRDFADAQNGGFFSTGHQHDDRIPRSKDLRGSSNLPDADGVAAGVLLELARLTGRTEYASAARRTLESLAPRWHRDPSGFEHALIAATECLRAASAAETIETAGPVPDFAQRVDVVTIRVYVSKSRLRPGDSLAVAIAVDIDSGWHLYGENPDAGFLVPVSVSGDGVLHIDRVESPAARPVFDAVLQQTVNTFAGRVWFRLQVTADATAPAGPATFALRVVTQACDDSRCLSVQTTDVPIPIVIDSEAAPELRHAELFR